MYNNNRSAKNRRMRGGASAAGPIKRFNSKKDFLLEVKKSHWIHHLDQRVTATDNLGGGDIPHLSPVQLPQH